jgi:FkbM family methyltransferase
MGEYSNMRASQLLFRLYSVLPIHFMRRPIYQIYTRIRRLDRRQSVVTTIDGIVYDLDLTQDIDSNIYFRGCHEPTTTETIAHLVKPGMVVFDIGANIGAHTLRLAKLVGVTGKVVAFEPTRWAFAKLTRNASLNPTLNLKLENMGLADFNGNRQVRIRTRWTLGREGPNDVEEESFHFVRLDDYVSGHGVDRLDFMKLDVDGSEYKVLAGAASTLKLCQPIIILEIAPAVLEKFGDSPEALLELLHASGYQFSLETDLSRRLASTAEVLASLPAGWSNNLICWPPSTSQ